MMMQALLNESMAGLSPFLVPCWMLENCLLKDCPQLSNSSRVDFLFDRNLWILWRREFLV